MSEELEVSSDWDEEDDQANDKNKDWKKLKFAFYIVPFQT